jgi:hypothetical protein
MTGRGLHVSKGGEGKAGWAGVGERGGGPQLGQKLEMGQCSKRNSFRISIDFRNLAEVCKIA